MKIANAVIKTLEVTEKGTRLSGTENKYFFMVEPEANKVEIKRAVEALFKVSVVRVNTMNYRGKLKRQRSVHYGRTPDWKRAVVTLKAGEKIDLG